MMLGGSSEMIVGEKILEMFWVVFLSASSGLIILAHTRFII